MAGVKPGGRDGEGSGVTLRLSGCAPLFSYVRNPRLPMLDERPPAELPARASAIAGASARVAAKKTASRMRQFGSRFDITKLVRKFTETQDMRDMGPPLGRRKHRPR